MNHEHDVTADSISIVRCRELLGKEADDLSDQELDQIRRQANALAHVIIDIYLEEHGASQQRRWLAYATPCLRLMMGVISTA